MGNCQCLGEEEDNKQILVSQQRNNSDYGQPGRFKEGNKFALIDESAQNEKPNDNRSEKLIINPDEELRGNEQEQEAPKVLEKYESLVDAEPEEEEIVCDATTVKNTEIKQVKKTETIKNVSTFKNFKTNTMTTEIKNTESKCLSNLIFIDLLILNDFFSFFFLIFRIFLTI